MSQVSNHRRADYGNALTTAVLGGAVWGTGQYVFNKKPFIDKNGNIKDSFVQNMEKALVEIKDTPTLETLEHQKTLEKEIDTLKSSEELKSFIKNKKDEFMRISDADFKLLDDELGNMKAEEGKNFVKGLFKKDGKYRKHFGDTLASCYDEGGKLVHDASKLSQEKFDALKKIIKKGRRMSALEAAGIFAAFTAAGCCLFEYFLSKKN